MSERTVLTETRSGTLRGLADSGVRRWRAIPYAQPPVGDLRLRAPRPVQPWSGVRDASRFGACAPQLRRYTRIGLREHQRISEDCLTLNVVAPARVPAAGLPVMVFFHGGAYLLGSSASPLYGGAALARRGVVYVSVNYRLGALGCLDLSALGTPDRPIDDNLMLRDAVAALRWVRDEIAAFGGDPGDVTIFGESAGAHMVTTLLAVPEAGGLFTRAIAQSPPSGMVRTPEVAATLAHRFAELLGVDAQAGPGAGAAAVLAADPHTLVKATHQLIGRARRDNPGVFALGPTAGTDLLPTDPLAAARAGGSHRVPLIIGTNKDEGRLFDRFIQLLPNDEKTVAALLVDANADARDRITAAYPGYPSAAACVRLGADSVFGTATWALSEAHARHAPTYVYRYDYAPRTLRWAGLGATHGTELLAVFDAYRSPIGGLLTAAADRRSARRVSDAVSGRWSSFARTGTPGEGWPRYERPERAVLVFDRRTRVEHDPRSARQRAWLEYATAAG